MKKLLLFSVLLAGEAIIQADPCTDGTFLRDGKHILCKNSGGYFNISSSDSCKNHTYRLGGRARASDTICTP